MSTTSTTTTSSTISTISSTSTLSTTSSTQSTTSTMSTSSTVSSSSTTTTWMPGVRLTPDIDLTGLTIEDEFGKRLIDSDVEYALDGRPIVWEQVIPTGYIFDLIGTDDTGWLTRIILNDLQALSSVANATYHLRYEGELKTVRFRNEDAPVISATPLIRRSNIEDANWYNNIRIKLMEVQ